MSDVLVLRALGLGDALTAVPALRSLRTAMPGRRIILAGPARIGVWLAGMGVIDEVLDVADLGDADGLRRDAGVPELAVNLHGRGPQSHRILEDLGARSMLAHVCPEGRYWRGPVWRPELHEVDRWLRLTAWIGARGTPEDLRLPPPGPRAGHVVIHPGAAHEARRWPAERWAAVVRSLADDGRDVVVTGGRGEEELVGRVAHHAAVEVAGRESLPALAHRVGTAALLLSGDTGVAHLATAFGTPSVTLFGPVSPELWGARIDEHLHVSLWTGSRHRTRPGDPLGAVLDERLAAIEVEQVLAAARDLLTRPPHTGAVREPAGSAADPGAVFDG